MKQRDISRYKLAECLHLVADIITSSKPNEILTLLEKALRMTKDDLTSRQEKSLDSSQVNTKQENTAPAQESLIFQEKSSSLSIKEFGRDVTSDTEFPTRSDLINFALSQGIQVSQRDTKDKVRKRLLSKAELRNMDELLNEGKE